MFQARFAASSPLDARLHDLLWSPEPAAVAAVLPLLPEGTGRLLATLVTLPEAERPPLWVAIALHLGQLGMKLSPWVAFHQALHLLPMAADRAVVYRMRAEWLARIGHEDLAERDQGLACRMVRQPPRGNVMELADASGAVVCAQSSPQEFQQLIQGFRSPLLCDPLRDPTQTKASFLTADVPEYGSPLDLSFLIVDRVGLPLLQVECDVLQEGHLGCRSSAIDIVVLSEAGEAVLPLALRQLEHLAQWSGVDDIRLQLWDDQPREALRQWITTFPHVCRRMRRATIDLSADMDRILADFRQTSRNLARWGLRELDFTLSREGGEVELVKAYGAMVEESGRHAAEDEGHLLDHVRRGEFALYGCRDAQRWLALVMVSFHADVVNYGGSVRAPDQVKSALPALMYQVIADAKRRGFRQFCLGDLHEDPAFSPKLRSIAAFKAGLTQTFRCGQWCDVAVGWPHRSVRLGG
ncbi:MAG: hypothetical protein FD176_1566 [Rhodospirillaceae bacterium]|nr:MAG: hypothetical protein FD176_1566 [Rhodospirillaceae bacterium]TNC96690.1 MAG: Uncharacterized protein FD119_1575 [Stygiobacter sp.]